VRCHADVGIDREAHERALDRKNVRIKSAMVRRSSNGYLGGSHRIVWTTCSAVNTVVVILELEK
jgi:hypothetical protein